MSDSIFQKRVEAAAKTLWESFFMSNQKSVAKLALAASDELLHQVLDEAAVRYGPKSGVEYNTRQYIAEALGEVRECLSPRSADRKKNPLISQEKK